MREIIENKTISNMEKKDWREELQEIIEEEETDMGRPMIPRYAKGYAKLVLEDFISELEQEAERRGLEKALGFIIGEGNINWAKDKIVESIKLLEEGKMEKKD